MGGQILRAVESGIPTNGDQVFLVPDTEFEAPTAALKSSMRADNLAVRASPEQPHAA
jgi:hypothetical protein